MKDENRSLFRADAIRQYARGKENSVLPRIISPRTFIYLWSLLGLLGVSSTVTLFIAVPEYTSQISESRKLCDCSVWSGQL